jgi:hypothetical protein
MDISLTIIGPEVSWQPIAIRLERLNSAMTPMINSPVNGFGKTSQMARPMSWSLRLPVISAKRQSDSDDETFAGPIPRVQADY